MATAEEKGESAVGLEHVQKTENFVPKAKCEGLSD